jgi:hypothetical protein
MRGQASVEWIVILSVAILVLAVMLSMNDDNYQFFTNNVRAGKVKAALGELKNAADFVYSQGKDARTRVYITIPPAANFTAKTLPAGKGQIQAVLYVKGKEEYFDVYTDANITGSFPTASGSYCMNVEYMEAAVNISRSTGSC